jgi:glycosyltransferase involved in cell wall biosynthesis
MSEIGVTVFTPTYNRAHTLHRVFQSLSRQTYRDFEWLVIDDGSSDGTGELIARWRAEADFPIVYEFQNNSGKHIAYRRAVGMARGELFINLDSDDSCKPEALERLVAAVSEIPEAALDQYDGVTCLCEDEDGAVCGQSFPTSPFDVDALALRHVHKIVGEKWGIKRTEVIREFPFPEVPGAKFVPESVVWDAMARRYKTRFINQALRIYHKGTDQISKGAPDVGAARGLAYWCADSLNNNLDYFIKNPKYFIKHAINYTRFSQRQGRSIVDQFHGLSGPAARALWAATLPLGLMLATRDRRRSSAAAA